MSNSLLSSLASAFELLSYVAVCLGIPVAIWQFRRAAQKEQADREYGTYNALDEKYLEFQQLCLELPRLDVFDLPDQQPVSLTPLERKQELVAFTMLFSIFERSFLMYADQSSNIKRRQWMGWERYIMDYCARPNFRAAWRLSGNTFDTAYQSFMEQSLTRAREELTIARTLPPNIYKMRLVQSPLHSDYIKSIGIYSGLRPHMMPLPVNHITYWLENPPIRSWRMVVASLLRDTSVDGFALLVLLRKADVVLLSLVALTPGARDTRRLNSFGALLKEFLQQEGLAEQRLLLEIPSAASPRRDRSIERVLLRAGFKRLPCSYERPVFAVGRESMPRFVPASLYVTDSKSEVISDLAGLISSLYLDFYLEWASLGQWTNPVLKAALEAAQARCLASPPST